MGNSEIYKNEKIFNYILDSIRYHGIEIVELELKPSISDPKYPDLKLNYNSNSSQFHNLNIISKIENKNFEKLL